MCSPEIPKIYFLIIFFPETLLPECSLSNEIDLDSVKSHTEMEIDESAFEKDIEEVEDEEINSVETGSQNFESTSTSFLESEILKGTIRLTELHVVHGLCLYVFYQIKFCLSYFSEAITGIECKYKKSHGCNFVSKSKQEASFHEKRHWEVKPYKCGHCSYQGE